MAEFSRELNIPEKMVPVMQINRSRLLYFCSIRFRFSECHSPCCPTSPLLSHGQIIGVSLECNFVLAFLLWDCGYVHFVTLRDHCTLQIMYYTFK